MTKQKRPNVLTGKTYQARCGCGKLYVTCNDLGGQLVEVFAKLGKSGGCGSATMEGIGKAISIGLRSGAETADFVKTFKGIACHRSPSCIDAIAGAIDQHVGGDPVTITVNGALSCDEVVTIIDSLPGFTQ